MLVYISEEKEIYVNKKLIQKVDYLKYTLEEGKARKPN